MGNIINQFKRFLLLAGDIAVLYLALYLTLVLRYGGRWEQSWQTHLYPFTLIYFSSLLVFYIIGLYDLNVARNNLSFFITLSKALLISAALAIALFYFLPIFGISPKTNLFINLLIFAGLFFIWRQTYNHLIKSPNLLNNILVLGQNEEVKELLNYIKSNPQLGFRVKKIVEPEDVKILYDLIETIIQEKIQIVLTTVDPHKDRNLVRNLYQCLPLKIIVTEVPNFYEKITGKIPVSSIEEIWFLENLMTDQKSLFEGAKRALDVLISLALGIVALVLTPFIALLVKMSGPGPVFYRQKRVGQDSRIFELFKFRTMVADAEKDGAQWAKEKDSRVTWAGKFLRKTRLDELPQLWNILKGEMSFVGPRPERPEFAFSTELLAQIPFYQIRHSAKPGLTGWAQIKYPYGSSVHDTLQKLQYDLYYIKNRSFFLEVAIILKTIKTILSGGGR